MVSSEEKSCCSSSKEKETAHAESHDHSHSHATTTKEEEEVSPSEDAHHDDHHSSHSHSHAHEDGIAATTAKERFGIDSFVYSRRRPFDPSRLEGVVKLMPADVSAAFEAPSSQVKDDAELESALGRLVRSKGFMWLANSHEAAYYWSHAGRFFQAPVLGRWWATLSRDLWPTDQVGSILADFDGDDGDRRQEIVFIGVDAVKNRGPIESALDACLLTDDEFDLYRGADEAHRRKTFPSNFEQRAGARA